jgi:hypothetical protein
MDPHHPRPCYKAKLDGQFYTRKRYDVLSSFMMINSENIHSRVMGKNLVWTLRIQERDIACFDFPRNGLAACESDSWSGLKEPD